MSNKDDQGQDKGHQNKLNVERDEETAQGEYSNLAIVNHSPSEIVVAFVSIMHGAPKSRVKSRIILTPQHSKRLLKALGDNIKRFEKQHGEIQDYGKPSIPLNFGPTGQA